MHYCILRRNSRWPPKMAGKQFCEKSPVDPVVTLRVKNFIEIALSRMVSQINVFLRSMQKFKMATKNGGKVIFVKCCQYTLQIPCRSKISSKLLVVGPVLKIKTVFWGFETKRNTGFRKCAEIWYCQEEICIREICIELYKLHLP